MQKKLEQIINNTTEMYSRCTGWHYKKQLQGDGTNRLTFDVPFQPDLIQIICTDPRIMFQSAAVAFFNGDFSGLGVAAAVSSVVRNGNLYNIAMTTNSVTSRIEQGAQITITNLKDGDTDCIFPQGLIYQVVATKMHEKDLAQRYEEFVESLTGSGTAHICKAKIQQAFTQEQWTQLKATKPDWTFTEV